MRNRMQHPKVKMERVLGFSFETTEVLLHKFLTEDTYVVMYCNLTLI
jgi:hypothetical protein